jgi:DNA-binding NarL/FixJ family response regulator
MIRVLVVDDHAVVRAGLAAILASTGDMECVGTAADAADARRHVQRLAPDVILLDVSMPGEDGVSFTRALRRAGRAVGILVLTSFCEDELVVEAMRAGADGYLLKESAAETILEGVRQVAAGNAPVSPAVARSLLVELRVRGQGDLLTQREREVLELLRTGHANRSIARKLEISERTVKAHVSHILQRIGAHDRTQAALWAERHVAVDGGAEEPSVAGGRA